MVRPTTAATNSPADMSARRASMMRCAGCDRDVGQHGVARDDPGHEPQQEQAEAARCARRRWSPQSAMPASAMARMRPRLPPSSRTKRRMIRRTATRGVRPSAPYPSVPDRGGAWSIRCSTSPRDRERFAERAHGHDHEVAGRPRDAVPGARSPPRSGRWPAGSPGGPPPASAARGRAPGAAPRAATPHRQAMVPGRIGASARRRGDGERRREVERRLARPRHPRPG